jgi:hypothetical protein
VDAGSPFIECEFAPAGPRWCAPAFCDGNAVLATTSLRASCVRPIATGVFSLAGALCAVLTVGTVALLRLDELDNLAQ